MRRAGQAPYRRRPVNSALGLINQSSHMRPLVVPLLVLAHSIAVAQPTTENLLAPAPTGYKVGQSSKSGPIEQTEMIPESDTLSNWQSLLTIQVFRGMSAATPAKYRDFMHQKWKTTCKKAELFPVSAGQEYGYPVAVWIQACESNAASGRDEVTYFKAIQGADSFYVVQKAFREVPERDQVERWMLYLKDVRVCDTRVAEKKCPKLGLVTPQ